MSSRRPIRDIGKRFQIVFYQLEKIMEDWGQCAGLSGNDVSRIRIGPYAELKRLFESRKFWAFEDDTFIPEEEFDNEPQATTVLEEENKRLKEKVEELQNVILNIYKNL